MWQKSPPTRFGTRYKEAIVKAAHVHLYTFANLTDIELNAAGRKVTGLEVKCPDGKRHQVKARHYILACGAIENVRYLLNANAIMKNGIGNQHDLVGRFFMEHPHVDSADMMVAGEKNMDLYYTSFLTSRQFGLLALAEEYQRQEKLLNYSAHLIPTAIDAEKRHMIDFIKEEDAKMLIDFMEKMDKANKEGKKEERMKTAFYSFSTRIEQAPNPDSRVILAGTADRYGTRHVKLNWQLSDLDKTTIRKANLVIGKELGRLGLGRLRIQDWVLKEGPVWPSYLAGGPHQMGITRMSKDPKKGVVDENCRVHGLPNLFIAGASVFPTSGSANPTLTIVALAIRLSDHLKILI
jgi:choline dehydrogenase-like flavoprotein